MPEIMPSTQSTLLIVLNDSAWIQDLKGFVGNEISEPKNDLKFFQQTKPRRTHTHWCNPSQAGERKDALGGRAKILHDDSTTVC